MRALWRDRRPRLSEDNAQAGAAPVLPLDTMILLGVWALSTFLWLQPGVLIPDGAGYFVYLPSITLDHDLVFFDEWQKLGMIRNGEIAFKDVTANGHLANHWTCGSAMAWEPAYLFGHLASSLTRFPRNGLSLPYNVPVVFTSAVAGLIALLLGLRASARYGKSALTAAIGVWFGSPLMWYSLRHATMSHAIGAAACAGVVALSLRLRENVTAQLLFATGLAVGFAFAVRPQNAPFILVPLLLAPTRKFGWVIAGAIAGGLPQVIVSQVLWGSPLAFANLGVQGNDWQAFTHLRLLEPIFSAYHGLAPWTPLLLFALAGFVALCRDDRRLGVTAIAMFVIQWLMVATLDRAFWGGAAFGQRRFDNCTIFFILGLAALFSRIPRWAAIVISTICCTWTLALFFAPLDLNLPQSFAQLFNAALHAQWRLSFVPATARLIVCTMMLATALFLAGLGMLVRKRATLIAIAYLTAWSLVFGLCGMHDDTTPWRDLIARNRAHPTATIKTTVLVIRNEARWLRGAGRNEEAQRAENEARQLANQAGIP